MSDELKKAIHALISECQKSVEWSDWPELQEICAHVESLMPQ